MEETDALRQVLSNWLDDVTVANISPPANKGLSGALVWRVSSSTAELCLRRWPESHPAPDQLRAIHGLLLHLHQQNYDLTAVPLRTESGDSFLEHQGHLWELTSWMPGQATLQSAPHSMKLANAMKSLAAFHQCSVSYYQGDLETHVSTSPGLRRRLNQVSELQQGEMERLSLSLNGSSANDIQRLCLSILDDVVPLLPETQKQLRELIDAPMPLQWCLRDAREEHFLFQGDAVSGLIDYGAVGVDSVAGDLARLLGSLPALTAAERQIALDAYEELRPLSRDERRAIAAFAAGGAVCSAANWIRWLYVENRAFPAIDVVKQRLEQLRAQIGRPPT